MSDKSRKAIKDGDWDRLGVEEITSLFHFLWGDAKDGVYDKTLWGIFQIQLDQLIRDRRTLERAREVFEQQEEPAADRKG